MALFAVEFDGDSHSAPDAQRRDRMKNILCARFELPLLRVNQKYLTRTFSNWDLLRWFCTVFFVKKDWDENVEAGKIALEDSVLIPCSFPREPRVASGRWNLKDMRVLNSGVCLDRDRSPGTSQTSSLRKVPTGS
jgi:hypothetical protein